MPVVAVSELWKGRQGTRDMGNVREYRRTFLVQTSALTDGPWTVGDTPITGIPPLYSYYQDPSGAIDLGALVVKYTPRQTEEPLYWEIDVEYSSDIRRFMSPRHMGQSGRSGKAEQAAKGQQDQNPLNRPPVIKIGNAKFQKPVDIALSIYWKGIAPPPTLPAVTSVPPVPILTSSGEKYEPRPEIDDTRIVVTIDRNEAIANFAQITQYQDAANNDSFWGLGPGCVKVNITCESAFENALFYWKKTYMLEFRRDSWCLVGLDQGKHHLSYDPNPKQIQNTNGKNGAFYEKELGLNGQGHVLANLTSYFPITQGICQVQTAPAQGCDGWEGLDNGIYLDIDLGTSVYERVFTSGVGPLSARAAGGGGSFTAAFAYAHSAGATIQGVPYYYGYQVYTQLPFAALSLPTVS